MSYKQNDRNEYCAAISTMVLITAISLILIIKLIYNLI